MEVTERTHAIHSGRGIALVAHKFLMVLRIAHHVVIGDKAHTQAATRGDTTSTSRSRAEPSRGEREKCLQLLETMKFVCYLRSWCARKYLQFSPLILHKLCDPTHRRRCRIRTRISNEPHSNVSSVVCAFASPSALCCNQLRFVYTQFAQ